MIDFKDYFETSTDYDTDDFGNGTIQRNHLYCYVSSSLLDGFVNYVEHQAVALLERYRYFKQERVDAMCKEYHTKFSVFDDDVIMLSRTEIGTWLFTWFDRDVSDCKIGWFQTTDSNEEVIRKFKEYCQGLVQPDVSRKPLDGFEPGDPEDKPDSGITGVHFIDPKLIKGWVQT